MPSFGDSIFLFALALLLFGPKKLPVLARELGKWVGEFRRASNEFKMQMEEELRQVEQADRQKQIAAMEAAAPVAPSLDTPTDTPTDAPTHSHLSDNPDDLGGTGEPDTIPGFEHPHHEPVATDLVPDDATEPASTPLPIAVSGELSIMPPSTGLPTPRKNTSPLGGLLDSIPQTESQTESQAGEASASNHEDSSLTLAPETEAHVP